MSTGPANPAPVARCPTCRKPAVREFRPFCSRRCADIDLARWLGSGFVIAGSPLEVADDTELSSLEPKSHSGTGGGPGEKG